MLAVRGWREACSASIRSPQQPPGAIGGSRRRAVCAGRGSGRGIAASRSAFRPWMRRSRGWGRGCTAPANPCDERLSGDDVAERLGRRPPVRRSCLAAAAGQASPSSLPPERGPERTRPSCRGRCRGLMSSTSQRSPSRARRRVDKAEALIDALHGLEAVERPPVADPRVELPIAGRRGPSALGAPTVAARWPRTMAQPLAPLTPPHPAAATSVDSQPARPTDRVSSPRGGQRETPRGSRKRGGASELPVVSRRSGLPPLRATPPPGTLSF